MAKASTIRVALLLLALAGALVPAAAVRKSYAKDFNEDDEHDPAEGPEALCTISTLESEQTSTKTCVECTEHCLTMFECDYVLWGDWEQPLAQAYLANTSCTIRPPSEEGEELCVLLAEGSEYVLDASPKKCKDCVKACRSREECAVMAWNFTTAEYEDLIDFECPLWVDMDDDDDEAPAPAPEEPKLKKGKSGSKAVKDEDDEKKGASSSKGRASKEEVDQATKDWYKKHLQEQAKKRQQELKKEQAKEEVDQATKDWYKKHLQEQAKKRLEEQKSGN
jgi:hypothetical protein